MILGLFLLYGQKWLNFLIDAEKEIKVLSLWNKFEQIIFDPVLKITKSLFSWRKALEYQKL